MKQRVARISARWLVVLFSAIGLLWFVPTGTAQGKKPRIEPSIDAAIVRVAPDLMAALRERQKKLGRPIAVGVLRFIAVKKGRLPTTSLGGEFSLMLANRLEVALILEAARLKGEPVGVIRNATGVVAKIRGANPLTPGGRGRLFGANYRLAWGKKLVRPDIFVTGFIHVTSDNRHVLLRFFIVEKNRVEDALNGRLVAVKTSPMLLAEMGRAFTRSIFDPPADPKKVVEVEKKKEESAFASAQKTAKAPAKKESGARPPVEEFEPHPLALPDPPVRLEVLQCDVPLPQDPLAAETLLNDMTRFKVCEYEFDAGNAFLKTLKENCPLIFRLRRDNSKNTYGIVLKVNGVNTLGGRSRPLAQSRMWVMGPNDREYILRGFQIDQATKSPFIVVPEAIARQRGMTFGADTGTISITVFRQRTIKQPPVSKVPTKEQIKQEVKVEAVSAGSIFDIEAKSAKEAADKLLEKANKRRSLRRKGVIDREQFRILDGFQEVRFDPDPTPLFHASIRYFDFKGEK